MRTADPSFIIDRTGAMGTAVGSVTAGPTIEQLNGLEHGTYTVYIEKNDAIAPNAGCETTASFSIQQNPDIPTLDEGAIQARTVPDTLCTGSSGTLVITDADLSTGDITDFNIEIRQGAATGVHITGSPFNSETATTLSLTSLAPDDYYITATNLTTSCSIAPAIINIADAVRNPQISLASMVPDQRCGASARVGGMEIDIDGRFDHTDHFTVQWVDVASGDNVAVAYPGVTDNETVLSGVPGGDYRIDVTNTNTGCSSNFTYTIPDVAINPSISEHTIVNQTICFPDMGSFELNEALFDGSSLDQAQLAADGFALEIYNGADPLVDAPLIDRNPATPYIFEDIGIGTYYAFVRKTASECISGGLEFTIEDERSHPSISITLQGADSTCMPGAAPNGTLSVAADGQDDTTDYGFRWYQGSEDDFNNGRAILLIEGGDASSNGSTSVGVATSNISGLASDTYTVEVTRTSTGCVNTADFIIPNVPTQVDILSVDDSMLATTSCFGNATISVTSVGRDATTDYTFCLLWPKSRKWFPCTGFLQA